MDDWSRHNGPQRDELDRLKICSQGDVQRMWELLMRPLGFRSTSLWVSFIGADDRPTRFLLEIAETDEVPDAQMVSNLYLMLGQLADEDGLGTGVAFLLARPGRDRIKEFDRRLAARLLEGADRSSLRVHPIHVANDVAVLAVTPDDLAA